MCYPCRKNLSELAGQTTNARHKGNHGVWQVAGEADESHESADNISSSSIGTALAEHTATELAQQEPKDYPPDETAEEVEPALMPPPRTGRLAVALIKRSKLSCLSRGFVC